MLAPIAWRTPPRRYGPWEQVVSTLTEGLVSRGVAVTLFATADSVTAGGFRYSTPAGYAENPSLDPKVEECLHISQVMEAAGEFDIIHNHFDFLPLTYSRLIATPMLTTIHGFSSPKVIPVYKKYNETCHYVSISDADRSPMLNYIATVYNGIDTSQFDFIEYPGDYLLYFGRVHPEKGTHRAIEVAKRTGRRLLIAGFIQDTHYFKTEVLPHVDGHQIRYVGNAGPKERNHLLGNAAALLHLISFDEPFGLSIAEAMCCGTPVIAINRGSMPELVLHGKTGFLVSTVDEALPLIGRLSTLSRRDCRKRATELFSAEKMIAGYLGIYQRILAG